MSIMLGTTLYSMTNEWLAGQYSLGSLIDEVGRRGIGPGVEVIGFQSLRGFPLNTREDEERTLRDALERNNLIPTSLASNADIALRADAWMDTDRSVEYMRPQIELAGRLGFPVVRTQLGLTPEVLEKVEPLAAKANVKLGMEVHAPEGPNTPKVMATREAYARIDSEFLGFVPDFSSCMRAIPEGMLAKLRRDGLSEQGVDALKRAWEAPGAPFQRYGQFAAEAGALNEPELPVGFARLVFTMFGRENLEDWREILPQVVHIHGKFYDVDENLESPSIDYEGIMRVFSELDHPVSMSTEWEGHAYLDADEQDAFDMVAQHHAMCRKFLGDQHLVSA
ncbi:sugar phosphate isomerase/epimerase [Marmoricola sp. URHB0036]|uniref:sugar phosphate isomerase/epimerase family protein n=1 Tax=Marmoricola sp. URHB0036 TaxID=1298863 RepID=UPI00042A8AC5|nr:TIM barrel protein [Marmoricola sp. URHB0036]